MAEEAVAEVSSKIAIFGCVVCVVCCGWLVYQCGVRVPSVQFVSTMREFLMGMDFFYQWAELFAYVDWYRT